MSSEHQHHKDQAPPNPDALHVGCGAQPPVGPDDKTPFRWNPQENIKLPGLGKWKLSLYNAERFHAGNVTLLQRGKNFVVIDSGCSRNYNLINRKLAVKRNASFFLINTHAHPDHTGGNENMARHGAIVVSHRNAREHMIHYEIPKKSGLPVVTFDNQMELYAGDQRIDLIGLPPGHTSGDVAVWIPGLNILHTGDAFMSEDYPLIDLNTGGTINGLIRSVSIMIRQINPETTVIPGHGDLASRGDLMRYRRMLRSVSSEVERYKNQGLDVEAVKDLSLTEKYDRRWGEGHLISGRQFVERVYKSLPDSGINQANSIHHSKRRRARAEETIEDIEIYTDEAYARKNKEGDVIIHWMVDDRSNGQTSSSDIDALTSAGTISTVAKQISDDLPECKRHLSIRHQSEPIAESFHADDMDLVLKSIRYQNNHLLIKAEPLLPKEQDSPFSTDAVNGILEGLTISIGQPNCP